MVYAMSHDHYIIYLINKKSYTNKGRKKKEKEIGKFQSENSFQPSYMLLVIWLTRNKVMVNKIQVF